MHARRVLTIAIAGLVLALAVPAAQAVTFTPAPGSPFTVGSAAYGVEAADFDGDSTQDLALLGQDAVRVRLGNGDGTFTAVTPAIRSGQLLRDLAVADFDHDGIQDLAVSGYEDALTIFHGTGAGKFTLLAKRTGPELSGLVPANFDDDGIVDLATSDPGAAVLLGNGDGTFTATAVADNGRRAVGDFDEDGNLDLASFRGEETATARVYLGNGDGTLAPPVTFAVPRYPAAPVAGDFDGDGDDDLAISHPYGDSVGVYLSDGDGTFTPAPAVPTGDLPFRLATADLDGNGDLDLVTGNGVYDNVADTFDVLLGDGAGGFTLDSSPDAGDGPGGPLVDDFDDDGAPDLLFVYGQFKQYRVLLNDGAAALVKAAGNTTKAPVNAFTIEAFATDGTLTYTGASRSFDGAVQCTKVVGTAATIVAIDGNRANRTMVQDNGAGGDKLVNTMTDLSGLTQKQKDKFLACVDPDLAKLNAGPALTGDAIQVVGGQ